jgi:hypothetical protein
MESAGYAAATPSPGLRVELYPFQTQSLQWMLDREKLAGTSDRPGGRLCLSAPMHMPPAHPECSLAFAFPHAVAHAPY